MIQSSCGGKNGKLNETIQAGALWSIVSVESFKLFTIMDHNSKSFITSSKGILILQCHQMPHGLALEEDTLINN